MYILFNILGAFGSQSTCYSCSPGYFVPIG